MSVLQQRFSALLLFIASHVKAQTDLPVTAGNDWYQQATEYIQQQATIFNKQPGQSFITINHANGLQFLVGPNGYTVKPGNNAGWTVSSTLPGKHAYSHVLQKENSLVYSSTAMDVEYVQEVGGLRQNFIVKERPADNRRLSISLEISSILTARVNNSNQLIFHEPGHEKNICLVYDGLKVWDANGKPLTAAMELNKEGKILSILVDDKTAAYPVTIDPLNRAPEWTTSADGILPGLLNNLQLQVQTTYGFTVAGLGDINGDGFDDVAVSAPSMADVISGSGSLSGVGAVFIYLGSATGLPVTPSKVLQPTTAVAGALFGYSIDAGDITGDGKNDIVIGAPLDRYQTSAASLLGTTTVNVTAGKVYVYRSEDLFSAPNPTPFAEVRLQGSGFFSTGVAGLLASNISSHALFGFAVAVTEDLNGDNKADLVIGSPAYTGIDLLSVQSGTAFVYYSNDISSTTPVQLHTPDPSLLGILSLPVANTSGLLFGFSVDGAGDFNNDGFRDVVVGAPAGADLSSLGGIFSGQVLGGSAYIFYGTGGGVNTTSSVRLQADPSGLLSNAANLFGYKVKGVENAFGVKTGSVIIGSPAGSVLSNVLGGLQVKAGQVHVFKTKSPAASGSFVADQAIASPRSSSILSILSGQTLNVSLLFGSSLDNMRDVNCDGIGDIIVGEPLSTSVPIIGADVTGGAAYIFLGTPAGTYNPTAIWDLFTQVSPLLGVNATALLGYSVAGAGHVRGSSQGVRSLVGGPANTLDFGVGLLNLGNTLGTTFNFAADNNGLGKAYSFSYTSCNITLPATLLSFRGAIAGKQVNLNWVSLTEDQLSHYELQQGTNGMNFKPIAIHFAKGGASNEYAFTDLHPATGFNYYRLKMIDQDGSFSYSQVVAVRFTEIEKATTVLAPNPVQQTASLQLTGYAKGLYRMELVNAIGQRLFHKQFMINEEIHTETITRNNQISGGLYWLNVYDNTNRKLASIQVLFAVE